MRKSRTFAIAGCIALGLGLSACNMNDKQSQPFNDAPTVGSPNMNGARIYAMPDGFNNVAVKCVGHTAITVLYHANSAYGGVSVTPDVPDLCP